MGDITHIRCSDGVVRKGRLLTSFGNGEGVIIHRTPDGGHMMIEGRIIVQNGPGYGDRPGAFGADA